MQKDILQENYATIEKEDDWQYIHFNWWVFGPYIDIVNLEKRDKKEISSINKEEKLFLKYFLDNDCQIYINEKDIFVCFKGKKNLNWNKIRFIDIIKLSENNVFTLKIEKLNLIYQSIYENENVYIINYYIDFDNYTIFVQIKTWLILKKIKENLKERKKIMYINRI